RCGHVTGVQTCALPILSRVMRLFCDGLEHNPVTFLHFEEPTGQPVMLLVVSPSARQLATCRRHTTFAIHKITDVAGIRREGSRKIGRASCRERWETQVG